jgi:hypothetical protein
MGNPVYEVIPSGSQFSPQLPLHEPGDALNERDAVDPELHWGSGLGREDASDILAKLGARSMRQIIEQSKDLE